MNSLPANNGLHLSANDQFKAQYNKYLRWSALAAVLLTILFFLISPNYVPNPYKLRQEEFEVVDLDDQEVIDIPPPPQEAPPPPKVIEAAPDDEVDVEVEIADTLMDIDAAITSAMPTFNLGGDEGFVASAENPQITLFQKPEYPEMARMAKIEGTVLVKVLVGPDGLVKDAIIMQSVHPMLDRAALDAARKCKFRPGKQRNIPVKAWMGLPFNFRLH